MTNGHHLARAVLDASINYFFFTKLQDIDNSVRVLFATISDNWGDYDLEQFWQVRYLF